MVLNSLSASCLKTEADLASETWWFNVYMSFKRLTTHKKIRLYLPIALVLRIIFRFKKVYKDICNLRR